MFTIEAQFGCNEGVDLDRHARCTKSEPPAPLFRDGDVAGQYGDIAGLDGGFHSLHNEICKSVWFYLAPETLRLCS